MINQKLKLPLRMVFCALLSTGCSGASSAGYDYVALSVSLGADESPVVAKCLTLPVLPGSQVDSSFALSDDLTLLVVTTREALTLTAMDGSETETSLVSLEQIQTSGAAFNPTLGNTTVKVTLTSGCQ